MIVHPGLYARVLDYPHEDTPRLELADWLDESSGDYGWERLAMRGHAELIRAGVALARRDPCNDCLDTGEIHVDHCEPDLPDTGPCPCGIKAARDEVQTLCNRLVPAASSGDDDDVLQPLSVYVCGNMPILPPRLDARVEIRRGFPDRIVCPLVNLLPVVGKIVGSYPVTRFVTDRVPSFSVVTPSDAWGPIGPYLPTDSRSRACPNLTPLDPWMSEVRPTYGWWACGYDPEWASVFQSHPAHCLPLPVYREMARWPDMHKATHAFDSQLWLNWGILSFARKAAGLEEVSPRLIISREECLVRSKFKPVRYGVL